MTSVCLLGTYGDPIIHRYVGVSLLQTLESFSASAVIFGSQILAQGLIGISSAGISLK